ncbi:MAG: saccharopine dehydrogenase C-terminal domain-containing protein [Coxiellaceae bacterium]|nr:saccharopine dehydrogenase C-terminal domain-containing protein [Coxiellaceae bacterium]
MQSVLVAGAGKIGSTIAQFLSYSGHYRVYLVDIATDNAHPHATHAPSEHLQLDQLDVNDQAKAVSFIKEHKIEAVVTALPYTCNQAMAELAVAADVHYFDLSEDVSSAESIAKLASHSKKSFVPQCGLAPGFVNIVASDLLRYDEKVRAVKIRCGALPQDASNALQYALTWSTDGLINEYGNMCHGMLDGKRVPLYPLEDLETIVIDGVNYEAFNTSGGVGTLFETYGDKAESITYKTMRYPGHCEKMKFLMNDLRLNDDRDTLKRIMETAIPTTQQDVVVVHVTVDGIQQDKLNHRAYSQKFYPKKIAGIECTAIQATTASGACAVIDTVLSEPERYKGFIKQEQFALTNILQNHFGGYLAADDQ